MSSIPTRLIAPALIGIAVHNFIFRHGDWHMEAPVILYTHFVLACIILAVELSSRNSTFYHALINAAEVEVSYLLALFSSIIIYRLFLHRLRPFKGPRLASVSKLWHVVRCIQTKSKNHLILDDLHDRYGDYVRTGPTEITVFNPEIFSITDGPGNKCKKAVWYDFLLPEVAVNTTRDKQLHDQRRRIWDKAFTPKAINDYQDRIAQYAARLESIIGKLAANNQEVESTEWFYWFSFDVMGEFAFARSFNMLEDEKWHHAVILLRRAMALLGPLSPVPWLAQIGFNLIPNLWVVKDWYDMMKWCKIRMGERIATAPLKADVSGHLIAASKNRGTLKQDTPWLNGDSIAMIIAGSDTVARSMVFLFYELALHPQHQEAIYQEIRAIDTSDNDKLKSLDHLNGCINETLRLHPPVPSGGYRETPPGGVMVGDQYIPGGITLVAPRYTIGRLESCFDEPNRFIPERWYSKPEMVKNRKAFMPFAQGRYSCVGKGLALAEMRYVTSLLLSKYTVKLAPGQLASGVEQDMRDQFTAAPGKLKLICNAR